MNRRKNTSPFNKKKSILFYFEGKGSPRCDVSSDVSYALGSYWFVST